MHLRHAKLMILLSCAATLLAACGPDPRQTPVSEEEIWGQTVEDDPVEEPITYIRRTESNGYGLPRAGREGIADLIALFPQETLQRDAPNIFSSAELATSADNCSDWSSNPIAGLPIEIEAVVTLHPRQYQKLAICDQDERHYGSYTIEDDTGGLLVLRDSRVAPYTYGDRVKLTVHAVMLTFGGDLDTRAVLVADVELSEQKKARNEETNEQELVREIFYERTNSIFGTQDVVKVRQVEGYVLVEPTNDNFNSMVLADKAFGAADDAPLEGSRLQCVRNCEAAMFSSGSCPVAEATEPTCRALCDGSRTSVEASELPTCWQIGIDAELGRRGFAPPFGTHLRATGPVVNSFDYEMWVLSLGQMEILD